MLHLVMASLMASSGTAVLYMSACASLCKRQPTIIEVGWDWAEGTLEVGVEMQTDAAALSIHAYLACVFCRSLSSGNKQDSFHMLFKIPARGMLGRPS
jgi:hypothetical protein